ncbi:N-acetylated-alpha-linked acidic dipeptidase-like protein 2 [Aaosphaeria arxii CBS 175.79]|uniref:N-acetylated-alpha-linked acidic dipeptidase-like protein 2 n=1 Tax=Aaosphaeria arxii CBS 175.79 TaxID=1450172 RepID=A0A6A5XCC2_9PLEO|nr:N-acetylated-alpha-linked acidic dipeptidase-like protein 2 [Aaosphaeria arxii CBS 175.79]KAF2010642.1 N-acetylated-alpha-linked acidic dipeptidase-like protein 2 [Aaosphaeria arxii CBS 175.79]
MFAWAIGAQACDKELKYRSHQRHLKREGESNFRPTLDQNENILLGSFDNTSISQWSYYYTHGRALAGQNKTMAQWTADRWKEHGFESRLDSYFVYMNYPTQQSIELTLANGTIYKPTLQEAVLEEDETTGYPNRVPAFHGYSHSGEVSAEYVYVGRGSQSDFDRLKSLGIELEGKIALAKYGGPFRGLKVRNAQDNGMIGVITFTDPGDDGNMTEASGKAAYPKGPARNPTSIQRGSVQFLSTYPGDPTTPGYPSKEDSPRQEKKTVPKIPSLPISWVEARPILQALNGHGLSAEKVNGTRWVGAIPNVTYSTGPAQGSRISLRNLAREETTWLWNTIGIYNGTNQDEVVVVGNHRDAWMIGGAADPHSGSSILIELAKAFNALSKTGWKPKRTIVLASWDGEEYGLIGSTEWVEEFLPWLKGTVVSYLNIDVGVAGTVPDFSASPELHKITREIAQKVTWPHKTESTIYDIWEQSAGEIEALGAQSDYTAFVHRGGIASIDMGTTRAPTDPIYHTHSNYDSYYWMSNFCDPGFLTHKAMGQYLTLLLYHLVNDELIPLEPENYTVEMYAYLEALKRVVDNWHAQLDLGALERAIAIFQQKSDNFKRLRQSVGFNDTRTIASINRRAREFSRGFISQGGLPGREFYQNLIFAPGVDTGYMAVTFPGITEAVALGNLTLAADYVKKTSLAIEAAAQILGSDTVRRDSFMEL